MKTILICTLAFLLMPFVNQCSNGTVDKNDISLYLPASNELKDWKPVDQPQKYEGEDLFLYINGGAEIYHEYGFIRIITHEYRNETDKTINLELFEMKDSSGAYGIYTFKTGDTGQKISIGNDGFLEEYYLNFWKGNVLTTITGFDSEKETIDGLLSIARAVDSIIPIKTQKPVLSTLLPEKNLKETSIKYLKGNLALYNIYEFDSKNIFGMSEGIVGDYGNFQSFVFRYRNIDESLVWYENARKHLRQNPRFHNFKNTGSAFSLTDSESRSINVELFRNYIISIMNKKHRESERFLVELKDRIKEYK